MITDLVSPQTEHAQCMHADAIVHAVGTPNCACEGAHLDTTSRLRIKQARHRDSNRVMSSDEAHPSAVADSLLHLMLAYINRGDADLRL